MVGEYVPHLHHLAVIGWEENSQAVYTIQNTKWFIGGCDFLIT